MNKLYYTVKVNKSLYIIKVLNKSTKIANINLLALLVYIKLCFTLMLLDANLANTQSCIIMQKN